MADDIAAATTASDDERRLHELGYAQELRRRMSGFSNFAVSFTIISILSGCLTLYGYGMNTGGPAIIVWGWPIVGIMTLFVGLAMAEVCSSFPTAGGLYYWAAKLAPRNGPAWSWFTGWFNFLGQVAVTAGIDFGCAFFINALLNLVWGVSTAHWVTIVIFAGILFLHGVMNQFGIRLVALLNNVSVWWHILGVLIIVGVLAFVPSKHASGTYVFTNIVNNTGWHSTLYVLLLGLLLAQYTFTGYDASAHMTEETRDASRSGPRGIVMSIVVSLIAGWVLLIGITFAIQAQHYTLYTGALVPPAQIFITAIGGTGAKLLLLVIIGAQLFCGMSSVTANSRMIYAFSRDGALPGSNLWHQVNKRTRTPTNAIWLAAGGALILGLAVPFATGLSRRAIDLIGAALEGRGKAPKCGVENAAHEQAKGAAAELVDDEKFYIASALAGGAEAPAIVHALERAFEIFDQDFALRPVERDAAGEGFAHEFIGNRHVGDDDLPALAVCCSPAHGERAAQRHELRIAFDVGDKVEHVGCRMLDPPRGRKLRHQSTRRRRPRRLQPGEIFSRVMGRAGQRRRRHHREALGIGDRRQRLEFLRRHEAQHRVMLARRLQILPDGQEIDVG